MRVVITALVVAATWTSGAARAQDPCAGVTCSGHGMCFSEGEEPLCLCDDGFEAVGRRCRRDRPDHDLRWLPEAGVRVVAVAIQEDGRGVGQVGMDRPADPGPLNDYVEGKTPWCSDFVSWVYRVAGVPFTGGYQGGWLVPTNTAIQRWYESRGAWVGRDSEEFAHYEPRSGDYLRLSTETWGHSAIVDRVQGDTLHTIEGNARGVVRRNRIRSFHDSERIQGFGRIDALSER